MKHLKYFLIIAFMPLLVSCELLGIEITTIKGHWQSNKSENGDYYTLKFEDETFDFYAKRTTSTYQTSGTWANKGDTITLLSHEKAPMDIIVRQLSMNTMTIQEGKKCIIMSRIYKDPDDKFMEVFALKRGFWFHVYMVVSMALGLLMTVGIFYLLIELVKLVKKWILKILRR